MTGIELQNLLIVVAVAFAVPFTLGLAPGLRLPAVVLEIVAGIVIGPSVLAWVEVDDPVRVLAVLGLAFLLFLSGLEIELDRLRGRPLALTSAGFAMSIALALVVASGLYAVGLAGSPVFVAIVLTATSLGIVVPVLKDAGVIASGFGQLVVAAGSIADFGAIILLSLLFSREGGGVGSQAFVLASFAVLAGVVAVGVFALEHAPSLSAVLLRLQDTTAQIRVRGAFVLLVALAALAETLGLETILGAFVAGLLLSTLDRDRVMTHPDFRHKLEAIGFGVFIPVFFVTSGVRFDLDALTASADTLLRVPVFLAALLVVRGLPALLYRNEVGGRHTAVAAMLQATSLPFVVAATQIGVEIGAIDGATAAALVGAGILSVLVFPAGALAVLGGRSERAVEPEPVGEPARLS
ncbi:MAG: cation:proton antiporter [Thermoleophilia bacterium]|nr:cation:proton antiporter [Thermoleophilia bacterium]